MIDRNEIVIDRNEIVIDRNEIVIDRNEIVIDRNEIVIDRNERVIDRNERVIDRNERVAGLEVYKMNPEKSISRVFISHAWNYKNEYYKLEKMLDDSPEFRWQNIFPGFVTPEKDTADEVEKSLRTQIESCDVVLVISDLYNKNDRWIGKEMDLAIELDKPIIGISCRNGDETPWEIRKAASEIVDWNGFELTNAIQKHSRRAAFDEESVSKLLELSWGSP